jgi:hypothetical protein
VVIRYSNGDIAFLESALPGGVDIVKWDLFVFLGGYKNYEKVVYRKLVMERSYKKMQKLEEFIKAALNKKYKFNPSKMLRKRHDNDFSETMKHNKSFFCSEIVASVYKNLGLLPSDVSAS